MSESIEEQKAALRLRIRAAEDAYDRLILGTSVRVAVDAGGDRLEFQPASLDKLAAHIAKLKLELAALEGTIMAHPKATRPIGFTFRSRC